MQQQGVARGAMTAGRVVSSSVAFARMVQWMLALTLAALATAWPGAAQAQSTPVSLYCPTPFNISVANGGSYTLDANACHGGFGIGIPGDGTQPAHGVLNVDPNAATVRYTHNGDSATSDFFTFDDGDNRYVSVNVTIAPASSPITVSPASLPAMTVGSAYSRTLTASGGTAPYTYALDSGTLPNGLSLSSAGVISGTPTHRGSFAFSVRVTDAGALTTTKSYSPTVAGGSLAVSPSPPTAAVRNYPYSVSFSGSGGLAPHTVAYSSGTLPPGLSFSGSTLSGTPTTLGSYTFALQVSDSSDSVGGLGGPGSYAQVVSVTLTVNAAPTILIAPGSLPGATVGAAYSQTASASGGTAPYTYTLSAGALPAGVSLAAGTGALTGTPTAGGNFNFTLTATDANAFSGSHAYALSVASPTIAVAPVSLAGGTVASAYSQALSASGGTAPYTYAVTAGALPAGLSLSAAGVLSGTPSAGGSFNFSISATDSSTGGGPYGGTRAYTLTVAAPTVLLSQPALPAATVASAYSQALSASGGTAPYSYAVTAGALPAGLSLSAAGVLSGTPSAGGSFTFTVTATDSSTGSGPYSGARAYVLTVGEIPPVAYAVSASVGYGSAGTPIGLSIGGGVPTSVAVASAPLHGTAIASGTAITYQPAAGYAGPDSFTYTASNVAGTSAPATVSVTVRAPTLTVAASAGLVAQVGVGYSQTFTWSGGAAPYTSLQVIGLPAGLSVTATSADSLTVSGTSTQAGSFALTVSATDSSTGSGPFTGTQGFTLVVAAPTLALAPGAGALAAPYGAAYSQAFSASGGSAPYAYTLTGTLPAGLSWNAGTATVSGTATQTGSFPVTVGVTDASSGTGAPFGTAASYVLQVGAPTIALNPGTLPAATVGRPMSASLVASGGVAPYAYTVAAGALPAGVTLAADGTLSGTPTAAGTFNVTVQVQDANGQTGARAYALTVAPAALVLTPASLPAARAGVPYSQVLTTTGGVAPYAYTVTAGALPAGVTLAADGTLAGTPTAAGTFTVNVQVSDSSTGVGAPATASVSYSLLVSAPTIAVAPASLAGGTVASAYSQALAASGGTAPYTYAVTTGALPAGLSLRAAGVLSGTPGTSGSFNFSVTATDALGFAGSQAYTVQIGDSVPVAVADSASTLAGQPVAVPVTANDSGVIAAVAIATAPGHGTAVVDGMGVRYTPAAGFFGTDTFTYTASGPGGTSAPATVSVLVSALPVPQAVPQAVATLAGQPVTVHAAAGASGGPFTGVSVLQAPAAGTLVVTGTDLVYTPQATATGVVSIGYTLDNAFGASAPMTATITVNPLPVAAARQLATVAGTALELELTEGASGGPFTGAAVVSLTPAAAGTATITPSGSGAGARFRLTFTPVRGFAGVATLQYTLSNAHATSAPAAITIAVAPRPDPSTDAQVLGVLNAQASAARRFAQAQIGNFQQHLEALHDGGASGDRLRNGLGFAVDRRCNERGQTGPGRSCATAQPADEEAVPAAPAPRADATASTWGLWTAGAINHGDHDRLSGGSALSFETSGVSAGADYRPSANFALGAGLGYGRDRTEVGRDGSRSDADSTTLALYASYHPGGRFYLDGLFGHQWLSFDALRRVGGTAASVSGERDGRQWFASLAAGLDYRDERLGVSPYARLDVARARLDGYTEQGDARYALAYGEQDVDTTTGSLGLRLDYRNPLAWGVFAPQLRLEYQHDFQDAGTVTLHYADLLGGPVYRATLDGYDRNRFVFGLGAALYLQRDLSLRLEYRSLLDGGSDRDQSLLLNVEKKY